MDVTGLVGLIDGERRRRGNGRRPQSIRAAAEGMGITHATLIDILKGRTQPSPRTCAGISDYLNISAATVLELAGHLPPGAVGVSGLSPAQ